MTRKNRHRQTPLPAAHPAEPDSETAAAVTTAKELDRIIFFSDAVFAIAITLLVLELKAPVVADAAADRELPGKLLDMFPKYFSFVFSFWMIAFYWTLHHRICRHLVRYTSLFVGLNFLMLMGIVLLPFSMGVFGDYFNHKLPAILYFGNAIFCGLFLWLLWRYASHGRRLLPADFPQRHIAMLGWLALLMPAVNLVSIGATLLADPSMGMNCGVLFGVLLPLLKRQYPEYYSFESKSSGSRGAPAR